MLDLLVVVAHPDDESFGTGGALLLAKEAGLRTGILTLTRGEAGGTLAPCPPEALPRGATKRPSRRGPIPRWNFLKALSFPNGREVTDASVTAG